MSNFLMKPKIDFAFKEIMNDEKARTGFLAAVLKLDPVDIKSTRILNPYLRQTHADDKLGILDVRILMNDDTEIDTEIQLSELLVWSDRSLFYASKMYTDQIKPGQKYNVFKKCVSISILDFVLFEYQTDFYSCFHILEDTKHFKYTDKMEFHVIELPKLPAELQENCSRVELWAQLISQDDQKCLEYEAREKAIHDYNQGIYEAEQRGRLQGEQAVRESTAKNLLAIGISTEIIAQATGLSKEQIEA